MCVRLFIHPLVVQEQSTMMREALKTRFSVFFPAVEDLNPSSTEEKHQNKHKSDEF